MDMKKAFLIALGFVATAVAFTSCVDDDKEPFEVKTTGYVLEEGEGVNTTFTPYFYFTSTSATYELDTIRIVAEKGESEVTFMGLERYFEYGFRTGGHTPFKKASTMNSKYNLTAIAKTGDVYQNAFELKFSDEEIIGPIQMEGFKFNGNRIGVNVKEMKNIVYLGFMFCAYNKDAKPDRMNNTYFIVERNPIFTTGAKDLTQEFSSDYQLGADFVQVKVFAVSQSGIYRESEPKTIAKGGKTFEEDKEN